MIIPTVSFVQIDASDDIKAMTDEGGRVRIRIGDPLVAAFSIYITPDKLAEIAAAVAKLSNGETK